MNLGKYLRQAVALERKGEADFYGNVTYADPVQIRARYEPDEGLIRSATGQEIDAESVVLIRETVALGDLIEGSAVRRVETIVDKRGKTLGYRCYL